ncbi:MULTISPECIES: M48 family metallopeptidase [Nocardiopsis]|uniref:Zn-dependent protease with chaperone function n=1 Tax=Nocardiopsis sinuspersici TaxID=501010 RepID=A0A7Y9XAP8_9ACTN|nr:MULTISPECIES: M48 family metallopeptidase [Nocardiopsis]NYH52331.1 Zn-dependent protease with chaperone function [Nocardiopsis sinuspersici]
MSHVTPPEGRATACSVHGVPDGSAVSGPGADQRPALPGYPGEPYALDADEEVVPAPAHPWEAPLLAVCVGVTLLMAAGLVHAVWSATGSWVWAAAVPAAVAAVYWKVRGLLYARRRAESVKISPTQFPEVYRTVVSLAAGMGLSRTPEVYVRVGGRHRETDAAGHGLRRYLVLSDELFGPDGRVRDPRALAFLVAHQLGHVAAGHAGFWRRTATLGADLVPGLGAALSRAMEYTADNHAYAHVPEGAYAARITAGGGRLYTRINMGEMADRARTDRGFSLLLYHLLVRRPGNTRRMAALRDRTRRGRVFL